MTHTVHVSLKVATFINKLHTDMTLFKHELLHTFLTAEGEKKYAEVFKSGGNILGQSASKC